MILANDDKLCYAVYRKYAEAYGSRREQNKEDFLWLIQPIPEMKYMSA